MWRHDFDCNNTAKKTNEGHSSNPANLVLSMKLMSMWLMAASPSTPFQLTMELSSSHAWKATQQSQLTENEWTPLETRNFSAFSELAAIPLVVGFQHRVQPSTATVRALTLMTASVSSVSSISDIYVYLLEVGEYETLREVSWYSRLSPGCFSAADTTWMSKP